MCASFIGNPRPPFDDLLHRMTSFGEKSPVIVSVDIPSGWHVEDGDVSGEGIKPDMLVKFSGDGFLWMLRIIRIHR